MNELAAIAGSFAVVQMLIAGYREWTAARRIVAVGGLDASLYAEHGCVPLQFAGSRFALVRAAVAVTGFFSVRPKSRKHAFAALRVTGMHLGDEIGYRDVRPRDRLRVMLDEGEHLTVFDRCMRRGVASFYRTLAIRELDDPAAGIRAHCVTVRTRGELVRDPCEARHRWLEYEVTAAPPRSHRLSGASPLADIPEDAIELVIVPDATYRRVRGAATVEPDGALLRWLLRRNPNPVVAAAHWVGKYTIPLVALNVITALVVGSVELSAMLFAFALPLILLASLFVRLVLLEKCRQCVRQRRSNRSPRKETPEQQTTASTPVAVPLQFVNNSPPEIWTGATAYGISAGRDVNANGARAVIRHAWRQFSYGILPPSVLSVELVAFLCWCAIMGSSTWIGGCHGCSTGTAGGAGGAGRRGARDAGAVGATA